MTWPNFISAFILAPANQPEQSLLVPLVDTTPAGCVVLGDRNYYCPALKERLEADGQHLLTPAARQVKNDPDAALGKKWRYSGLHYLIDTVFGQLTERFHTKCVWACDTLHLLSRIYRKVLAHTLAMMINMDRGNQPLQLEYVV